MYTLIVGKDEVFCGNSYSLALSLFRDYSLRSETGKGRGAFLPVILLCENIVFREYNPE